MKTGDRVIVIAQPRSLKTDRMTADAAWAIAEEIYRKERGR